ncbi:phage protein [Vibrio phage RYC]|nr:phage protein [Vibrio phage RYC]
MEIIVGSSALFGTEYQYRSTPVDVDIWTDTPSDIKVVGRDELVLPTEILQLVPYVKGKATPDAVYTIKCSHLGWDNRFWDKHKRDTLYLQSKGCQIIPELLEALLPFWEEKLGDKSFLSLNKDKENFFTDNVTYVMDHDELHELVAYPSRPVYERCLKDGEDVLIDKQKFFAMDKESQLRMFREEITTIAIERWIINPHWEGKVSWLKAYQMSVRKTITSLTKNWATTFIILNLKELNRFERKGFTNVIKEINNGKYRRQNSSRSS